VCFLGARELSWRLPLEWGFEVDVHATQELCHRKVHTTKHPAGQWDSGVVAELPLGATLKLKTHCIPSSSNISNVTHTCQHQGSV
jgi:hypothetical protein